MRKWDLLDDATQLLLAARESNDQVSLFFYASDVTPELRARADAAGGLGCTAVFSDLVRMILHRSVSLSYAGKIATNLNSAGPAARVTRFRGGRGA